MEYNTFFKLLDINGLSNEIVEQINDKSSFIKRKRTIDIEDFLYASVVSSTDGQCSYNDIAAMIDNVADKNVSKQAIAKKFNKECIDFIRTLIEVFLENLKKKNFDIKELSKYQWKRIIVQDSTIIKLTPKLYEIFSGVSNKTTKSTNARIQVAYDLISGRFIYFRIDPYSVNDIAAASDLEFETDDMVLRDRGYLSYTEIQRHLDSGADCIYRHRFNMILLDVDTFERIDLNKLLRKNSNLDMKVRLNNKDKTIVRLVSAPLKEGAINERRRKVKKDLKIKNPSKEYLEQLQWSIYITTVENSEIKFNDIMKLYALRWRIEIIFKSWKSSLNFANYHEISENQAYVIIYSRFLMVLLTTHSLFNTCKNKIYKKSGKYLSLLKFQNYLAKFNQNILPLALELKNNETSIYVNKIERYCCYDKRKRINYEQLFMDIMA